MRVPIHVFLVVGSRPEAIKLAPLALELRRRAEFRVTLCSTEQQRDLIPDALNEFGLEPDVALDAMNPGQSLSELAARLMSRLGATLQTLRPDIVVVQGDTTSAMVGALAAFYARIPVAHVEAGMRTGDRYSPFPEEINRKIITQCATAHYAATPACRNNLLREGVAATAVAVTGNTVIDALLLTVAELHRSGKTSLPHGLDQAIDGRRLLLVTSHRRENLGDGMDQICQALRHLASTRNDIAVVYPLHPNPEVARQMRGWLEHQPRVHLIPAQPYRPFIELMHRATLILTDSGGLQEEAPSLGKPLLVLRHTTERPEGVEQGLALLVGPSREAIIHHTARLLDDAAAYAAMTGPNPYGDGQASGRIAELLAELR